MSYNISARNFFLLISRLTRCHIPPRSARTPTAILSPRPIFPCTRGLPLPLGMQKHASFLGCIPLFLCDIRQQTLLFLRRRIRARYLNQGLGVLIRIATSRWAYSLLPNQAIRSFLFSLRSGMFSLARPPSFPDLFLVTIRRWSNANRIIVEYFPMISARALKDPREAITSPYAPPDSSAEEPSPESLREGLAQRVVPPGAVVGTEQTAAATAGQEQGPEVDAERLDQSSRRRRRGRRRLPHDASDFLGGLVEQHVAARQVAVR